MTLFDENYYYWQRISKYLLGTFLAINPASKKWLADSVSRMQFDERLKAAKDRWDQKEISIRSVKGPLPTLMHCAPRTQIPRISCYTILPIAVKGLSKDLVSIPTTQTISWRKIVIPSNDSGYLLEKIVIRSNGSVRNNRQPRYCYKSLTRAVCDEPVKRCKLK